MRVRAAVVVGFLLFTALSGACSRGGTGPKIDKVSVRLKWLHQAQFAGFYVAVEKGYYAEEHIEVTLNPGGPDVDEPQMVASEQDDFGVVGSDAALVARSKGLPIQAIAVVYQINPGVYFALQESGIKTPQDFIGKRVQVYPTDVRLPAMLAHINVRMDQIEAAPPAAGLQPFLDGEVDVWSGYLTEQVIALQAQGYALNIIYPDDYGVHTYADCIITTDSMIDSNPALVERFLRATLKGWQYAIEHPEEAGALALKYDPALDLSKTQEAMVASVPLIYTGKDHIGSMSDQVWQETYQLLLEYGLITQVFDPSTAFTNQFLDILYPAPGN